MTNAKCIRLAVGVVVLACGASGAVAAVHFQDISCGTLNNLGRVVVNIADAPVSLGAPFACVGGPGNGQNQAAFNLPITATFLPQVNGINGMRTAWMQVITEETAPGRFRDANNAPAGGLTAPWPDTTPGGYNAEDFCESGNFTRQVFDNLPWYGNNVVGPGAQAPSNPGGPDGWRLFDAPSQGAQFGAPPANARFFFESWLVCVSEENGPNNRFTVLPLLGFTWGFTVGRIADAMGNNNGTQGDVLAEYSRTSVFGGFRTGAQGPTQAFIDGYNKNDPDGNRYFNIRYDAFNEQNCTLCIPAPGAAGIMAMPFGLAARRRRAA